jgi:hypothetical protein
MFVEPQPGSGFDRAAPAYLVRRLLGRLLGCNDKGETGPQVQQRRTATPATEPADRGPDEAA